MRYTYLLIDLFTILVPFLFSFHPRLDFKRTWPAFLPAVILVGIVFLIWDAYFTQQKIWGFNPTYLLGIYIGNLPVEEVLFFLCIPYSCVFTYHCLNLFIKAKLSKRITNLLTALLIAGSIAMAVIYHGHRYTAYTFTVLPALLFTAQFVLKVSWLPQFYLTYLILLVPFLIVNGLLTGTGLANPVVWYNNSETVRLRILTIPAEDVFYGMDLILLNVVLYRWFQSKNKMVLVQ
jgi:lycopene cyclase domain-containing protein